MEINRSIDIEDKIREALSEHMTAYCAPLPAKFDIPCILVQQTGGDTESTASGRGKIDTFIISLDSRADTEAEALEYLRTAIAILEASTGTRLAYLALNSHGAWGQDPVRPELAMCTATLIVKAHRETITI